MGTRNKTRVYLDDELRVNQYGQWDGYPTGMGEVVMQFCRSAWNMANLVGKLSHERGCEFINPETADSVDRVLTFIPVHMGMKDAEDVGKLMDTTPFSRDWGSQILYYIAFGPYGMVIPNNKPESDDDEDRLFIEGIYTLRIKTDDSLPDGFTFELDMDYNQYKRHYTMDELFAMSEAQATKEMETWEKEIREKEEEQ